MCEQFGEFGGLEVERIWDIAPAPVPSPAPAVFPQGNLAEDDGEIPGPSQWEAWRNDAPVTAGRGRREQLYMDDVLPVEPEQTVMLFLRSGHFALKSWQPDVRLKSLLGLQGLYDKKKLISKMDLFTNKFKDRLVSMTLDKDQEVAVQAMKLLIYMSQNCEDVFMSEDYEILYQFVYTAHRPLAAAAGEFLYKRLLNQQEPEEEQTYEDRQKFVHNARHIKTLLIFFLDNELHDHVTYLVDSLWDCASSLLKDWECMTALLLEDCREEEEGLSDAQKRALIGVVTASVQQAVKGHPPAGRGLPRKILAAKERKLQFEDCARITEHFIVVLPQLLAKYSSHTQNVVNLLQISQHFNLDAYKTKHLEKHLDALLRQLKDIAEKHSDSKVLEACSRTYNFLCNEELINDSRVSLARSQLIDAFVDKLNQLLDDLLQKRESLCANEDVICQISSSLRRVAAFHNAHNLTRWSLYKKTFQLLDLEMECGCLPAQIVLPALQCTYYSLLWQLTAVMEKSPSKESLLLLKTQTLHFFEICRSYLNHNNKAIQEQAFTLLCDLLMILNHQNSCDDDVLKVLSFSPDSSLQSELLTFVQDHVFIQKSREMKELWEERKEEEYKLNDLHKKRRFLSSYCKLIVYNVVEMASATEIYKHYMKSYTDFGDIIKETLNRTRQYNRIESAKILILCLQQLFERNLEDPSSVSSFNNMKELARRFSLTFGLDQVKCRESVAMIHKEGIEFAFKEAAAFEKNLPPSNLSFLFIISEFSSKLLRPDKILINGYLQRFISEQMLFHKGEEWHPLIFYKNSLMASEDDESSTVGSLSSRECSSINKSNIKRKLSEDYIAEIRHTKSKNGASSIPWASHLTCISVTNKKRHKCHEKNPQELYIIEQKKRISWGRTKVEKSPVNNILLSSNRYMEDGNEEADVDVIDADQVFEKKPRGAEY
ncbi:cohesin subunit SA-2-like isoform X2 [Rhinatrema bivittatum]|uniref:cohesin subunit SA-2-like isoform X2 n=1 Tax=Rhinatrema bivittatum TaxID=194408 RepID=UPI00112ED9AC|nr:cohesin subunit SA-2-like isoform X2 [Rhinatrema bivittatum]